MTIDEAIEHAEEISCGNDQCAKDHAQLADWLRELRRARMEIDLLKTLRDGFRADAQKHKAENAKLRESVRNLLTCAKHEECEESCPNYEPTYTDYGYERNGSTVVESEYLGCCTVGLENCNSMFFDTDEYLRELGIEEES